MLRFTTCLFAALLLAAPSFAQTLGEITGIVTDASGAVVAGATVTATNTATGAAREATTNPSGVYSFPALTPGVYDIRVTASGFKASVQTGAQLQVQQTMRIDFPLAVGQVSESVEVSASAAVLATDTATVGTVIENKKIVDLPLNGRNALSLASLSPNVSFGFPAAGQAGSRQGGIRADRSISIAGGRSQFNRFTLDGIENTDPNFNTYIVEPSVDALQEFKVQSGVYPAEFGRGVSQVNILTKGGGNDYHGTLFYFLRNEVLDAKNYAFTTARPPKDPFKLNQYGFTLSGPISIPKLFDGKNRLFFMTNYEWFRQRRAQQAVYTVPLAATRAGDFSMLPFGTQGIYDPLTRSSPSVAGGSIFPGNVIPTSRIHPTSVKLLEFYPSPNLPGTNNNFVQGVGRPINRDQFISRFDFVESANSQWFGRYSWGDENQLVEAISQNGEKVVSNFNQYMVSNTRVLTPSLVNEFRFGLSQFYNTNGPELAFTRDVVSELSIPGLAGGPPVQWGIPSVALDHGLSGFGNGSEGPYENNNRSMQFINNVSWIRGKHTLKFGGEFRNDVYRQVGNQFARSQLSFLRNATRNPGVTGITGDSFADFLLGQTQQAEAAVSIARADFRANTFYLYIDDTWKITNRVTLNVGLRYENTPPWTDQTGTLFNAMVLNEVHPADYRNANVAPDQLPFFMRQAPSRSDCYEGVNIRWVDIATRCDGSFGPRLVGRDNNDWAPRVGITWAPSDKWVIRTGGGMFYSQDTGNPRFDMARNLAGRLRDNSDTKFLTFDNAFSSIAGGVANVPRPYAFANPWDRRTPYTWQYIFNIQRELWGGNLFEIGYLGSVSRRLEGLRSVNEAVAAPRSSNLSVPQRSPFPNFGIIQLVDNGSKGNYNSLAAKLTKRYSNGVTYLVGYTWAKSIDTASAIRNQGNDTLFPQNSYCRECERSRSAFDTRHRLVVSGLWDIPVGKGRAANVNNGFLNAIVGGWQVSSIITMQSGFPFNVTQSGDPANVGHTFARPNATGVDPYEGWDSTTARWWNPAAFTAAADGQHGNVGRMTATTPGVFGWDFSMLKDFSFTEQHRLQFRFEAFNFPNHPNWGNPNGNILAGTVVNGIGSQFGQITGTRTNMRNLQMALKYYF